jgi:hypothetical protein
VRGCTAEENEGALNLVEQGLLENSVAVTGLPLTNKTVAYYYVDYFNNVTKFIPFTNTFLVILV